MSANPSIFIFDHDRLDGPGMFVIECDSRLFAMVNETMLVSQSEVMNHAEDTREKQSKQRRYKRAIT